MNIHAYHLLNEIETDIIINNNIKRVIKHFELIKSLKINDLNTYHRTYSIYAMSLNGLMRHLKHSIPEDIMESRIKEHPELLEYFL